MQDIIDIKFSKSELNSLAKTQGTCVSLEKKSRVVFLLPSQLSDIKTGIKENLDSNLLKYDYETKAIIIGYEKIKILSKYGSILYGYSKIALRIQVNLYLFKPAVGRLLQGVVCKQSGRHLGCLVHKGFNVSVPLEDDEACGWDFAIGQDVKFTVVKLDLISGPLPYIRGRLYIDGADCQVVTRDLGSKTTEDKVDLTFDDREEDGTSEDGCGLTVVDHMLNVVPPEGDHHRWGYREEPLPNWHQPEGGIVSTTPGQHPESSGGEQLGSEEGEGRNSLISQLLKTVERSIAEEGLSLQSPPAKKGKPKRASLEPQSPARKASKAPLSIPTPLAAVKKEGEPTMGEGTSWPMTPPPSGRKVRNSSPRSGVNKKGAGGKGNNVGQDGGSCSEGGGGGNTADSGSIIDRLLEMSRRELLGSKGGGGSPRGKKRKAEESSGGEEGGSRKKILKKAETMGGGAPSLLVVKREHNSTQPTTATDPSSGSIDESIGPHLSSEKSVPSKTRKPSQLKESHVKSVPHVLGRPSLSGLLDESEQMKPSRVKRKSLPVGLEAIKQEK